jgi:O-antigen ligase
MAYAPLAHGSLTAETEFGLKAGAALLIVLIGLRLLLPRSLRLAGPPAVLSLLAALYLSTVVISALLSPYPLGSLRETVRIVVHVAGFFLAAALLAGPARRVAATVVLLATTAAMATLGALQLFGVQLFPTVAENGRQVTSTFFHYSHYAGFLDLAAPFALGVALLAPRPWLRLPAALIAIAAYANAGLTFSYAGWGALGLATLVLLVVYAFRPRPSRSRLGIAGGLVVAALAAGLAVISLSPRLSGTLPERLEALAGTRTEDGRLTGQGLGRFSSRLIIAESSLPILLEHLWTGVGPGNFVFEITRHRPERLDRPDAGMMHAFVNYAHNDYLQVATETGVPSALLFMAFWLLVLFLPAPQAPRWFSLGTRMGILALLVHGLMDGNLTVNHASAFLAFTLAGVLHSRRANGPIEQEDRPESVS